VCDDAGKAPLAQALFFCGSIAGGVLMGYIADRFGRVPALMLCMHNKSIIYTREEEEEK
jgi:MFS family permease